jgi:spermidine synthase
MAGLVYELAWSRYLALFVGHSAYAQVLVIAVFLGGLAAGSLVVGERSRRLRSPLAWYAGAEVLLAVAGLGFHLVFRLATDLTYTALLPSVGSSPWAGVVQWSVAVALILPQSVVLGTTFPLMVAGVLRSDARRVGPTVALLYFVNSLGGAAGVLVGGFGLVAWSGLPGLLAGGALLNLVAAVLALLAQRRSPRRAAPAVPDVIDDAARSESPWSLPVTGNGGGVGGLWRLLLAVSFLTALASFIYEIGWIRMLSLVMGSATHSFELMLSAFILGLAIGSWLIRKRVARSTRPVKLLGWIQWVMGLTALATLPIYQEMFDVMAYLVRVLPDREGGYTLFSLARYGMALAVMLPSTICAGMTLPLITGTLLHGGTGERSIGWVYGVNTLGSLAGVVLAGLVLLPAIGLEGMIAAGAVVDMGLGVMLLAYAAGQARAMRARVAAVTGTLTLAAAGGVLSFVQLDRAVTTAGVFRYGYLPSPESRAMLYYADGRTATVGVHRDEGEELTVLTTNGKPDASLGQRWLRSTRQSLTPEPIHWQDESTQVLAAIAALAHVPGARTAAMIGHGSGVTGHYLLAHPSLDRLVTIEIEPEMIRGSRAYYPANARVFDDPRSALVIDDAKAYFSRRGARFDLILSEPSNPWVSGTASLFTQEFYRRVGDYLTEDGIFGQWFQLYEITDEAVLSVLAALHRGFRHYRAFLVGHTDLLVVATNGATLPEPDWSVARTPDLVEDLSHVHPFTETHLNATRVFDSETLAPVLDPWPTPNSDFFPYLDLAAERARFRDDFARGVYGLCEDRFDVVAALEGRSSGLAPYEPVPVPGITQMQARGIGAWLRAGRGQAETGEEAPSQEYAASARRYGALLDQIQSGAPPPAWDRFVASFLAVDADLHAGTAGSADSVFYGRVRAYLEGQEAPEIARAVVEFMYGLSAWDFAAAAGAADVILAGPTTGGLGGLAVGTLLDGAVVSYLTVGDAESARRTFDRLVPHTDRGPYDLRSMLLDAYIRRELPPRAARP